ncbi:MAG: cyclodeaminase/cyclohydrolase family protein [Deltaproteobacteria bacterium]
MPYINASIRQFLRDCAARTPAPGGGAVAALAAAESAALIEMAALYTLRKPGYEAVAGTMRAIRARATRARVRCARLLDEDVAAYRAKDMRRAVAVPLEVATTARALSLDAFTLVLKGNKNLRSDAALAVLLAATAFLSALSYVQVNLKTDKDLARRFGPKLAHLKKAAVRVKSVRLKTEAALGYSLGR